MANRQNASVLIFYMFASSALDTGGHDLAAVGGRRQIDGQGDGHVGTVDRFGRALLAYTAMQKGAHDAARYIATLPLPARTLSNMPGSGSVAGRRMASRLSISSR